MDVIVAGYQIQQRNADFIILEDSLSAEEYGVGFKKGNTGTSRQGTGHPGRDGCGRHA